MTSPAFPSAPDLTSSESLIKRGSSERGTSSTDKEARDLAAGSSPGRDFSFRDFLARDRLRSEARSASAQKSPKDDSSADSKADAASSPSDKKPPATDDDAAAANDTRDAAAQDVTPAVAAPALGVSARQILLAAEAAATNAASDAAATPPSAGPKKPAAATDDDSADAPAFADGETVGSTAVVVDPSVLAMAIIAPPPVAPDAAKPLPTTGAGSSDASTGAATTTSSGVLDGAQISATDTALAANAKSTLPTPSPSVANQAATADADPKSSAATTSQTSDQSSVAAKIADGRISHEMAGKSPTPTALSQAQEKTAAAANAAATTENMGKSQRRNNFLTVDSEQEKKSSPSLGTEVAKSDVTMATRSNAPTANAPQESIFPVRPEMVNAATVARADAASGLVPGADSVKSQAGVAVNVIREVVAATDDMRAQERSSVSLQFNFKDEARLDVRVTYRDGAVHSTFVTDSPELRDTLSREWQVQASAASAQPKPYRLADPVFASNASGGQPSGFSLGGDSSRQSSQQQPQARPDSPSDLFPPSAFNRAPVTASASARPAPAANAETVRHLQVFA